MKNTYELPDELQKVENEVDDYYKSNPLVKLPFATAVWSLLAYAENWMVNQAYRPLTSQESEMVGNKFVTELKDPISWLYHSCKPDGQVPFVYNRKLYQAAENLFKLGQEYAWFAAAYTYARWGWVKLELQGSTIQPTEEFFIDIEYEAYGRLIKAHQSDEAVFSVNFDNLPMDAIVHSLRIDGDRFRCKLNPKMVSDTITAMKPLSDEMFRLPSEWCFSRYSLGDFRKVFETISAMVFIHSTARKIVMNQEGIGWGYLDSIYVLTYDELLRRVIRYSGVPEAEVRSIFDDLTYGNRGILNLDIALQPLIKLNSETYAIMPQLWFLLSPERNFTVLLNRLKDEQRIYSKLVDEKEDLIKQRFISGLSNKSFRCFPEKVSGLPDVDLAIINDSEKTCLLLELKWFIAPGEFREVVEKSQEIEKGICQSLKLKQAFEDNHRQLLEKLDIDSSYRLEGVVVSENWIGYANVQSPEVPVIQADHLIAKLKATEGLQSTIDWLKDRKYLPKEGEHFKVRRTTGTIGNWSVKWYGIQPLIEDAFFPL